MGYATIETRGNCVELTGPCALARASCLGVPRLRGRIGVASLLFLGACEVASGDGEQRSDALYSDRAGASAGQVDVSTSESEERDASTTGGEEIEVADFRVHECGNERQGPLLTGRTAADLDGLRCVAWGRSQRGTRLIDLVNFNEGCGLQGFGEGESLWRPNAVADGGHALRLRVEWDFEGPSGCGNCLHDFSFELSTWQPRSPTTLEVETRACSDGCAWNWTSFALPLGDVDEGIRCEFAPDPRAARLGGFHEPPGDKGCDVGFEPVTLAGGGEICAQQCASDADCPLPDVLTCQESTCVVIETH